MKIVECAFVAYTVTDRARARAFYEGVLGLTPSHVQIEEDPFWIEYEIGGTTLGIGNEPFLRPCGDGPQLVVEVAEFDEAVHHLKAHGVPFALEPFDMPRCRAAIVFDPDGNKLGVHWRYPPDQAAAVPLQSG